MRTGLMRRVVTIRTMTRTPDGMGGYTETPTDVTGIPARIDPMEGREQVEAMQTGMQRPHRITMRYRTGMTGAKTLIYEGRTFDIKSIVDPEEKHRELHITADEVNA
jgi:SPP1 family predicted phage head-tail adaptor